MSAQDQVTRATQILGQILFHLDGRLVRHGIQMRVKLGHQPDSVLANEGRRFDAAEMIGEPLLGFESGHPHIKARFPRIPTRVGALRLPQLRHRRVQQHNVDVMMRSLRTTRTSIRLSRSERDLRRRRDSGGEFPQGASLHDLSRFCAASIAARSSGGISSSEW